MNNQVNLENEFAFGNISTLGEGVTRIIPTAFTIASLLVIFYFLIAAYELIISQGDKNDISRARSMITHAIIGFILLMMIFFVLQYLPEKIGLDPSFKIIR